MSASWGGWEAVGGKTFLARQEWRALRDGRQNMPVTSCNSNNRGRGPRRRSKDKEINTYICLVPE